MAGSGGVGVSSILSDATREAFEIGVRNHLEASHSPLLDAVYAKAKAVPELGLKVGGDILGHFVRFAIFEAKRLAGKKSVTLDVVANYLATAGQDGVSGIVDAFAEWAHHGGDRSSIGGTKTAIPSGAGTPRNEVVRSRAMPGDAANHVHRMQGETVMCLAFRTAKDAWDNAHKPTLLREEGGKGGKDRGPRASVKLADAEAFPAERFALELAQQIGYEECPKCQPYTKAAEKAKQKEAEMADTEHDTAGQPAPVEKAQPVPDWAERVGMFGRWLAGVYAASLAVTDLGDELKTVPVLQWTDTSYRLARKYAGRAGLTIGPVMPDTDFLELDMPERLDPDDVEAITRLIFVVGEGRKSIPTHVMEALEKLRGSKKAAPEPKKHSPWLRRFIAAGVVLVIVAILAAVVSVGTIVKGVADAANTETSHAAPVATGKEVRK